jgi:apolipoprotein N-acyltransferase
LTQEATGTDHDLIIWPEATVRSSLLTDAAARESVLAVAERSGTPLLFGAMAETEDREQSNSAWLISPHGDLLGSYTKARPLPFAEYRPEPLSFLRRWWPSPQPAAGVEGSMFLLPEVRLAPSICYEATFPGFFRPAVRRGADLLLNLTNDVWFGDSSAPYQHLQAAAMRAVESRRWLVRAANSGVSAIIDPSGRIVSQVPLQTQGALRGTVVLLRSDTLYTRGGNWFVHLCLGAMLARWLCRRLPWKRAGRGRSLRCATGC